MMGAAIDWTDEVSDVGVRPAAAPPEPAPGLGELIGARFRESRAGPDWGLNRARYLSRDYDEIRRALEARGHRFARIDLNGVAFARRRLQRGDTPNAIVMGGVHQDDALWTALADERRRDPGFLKDYAEVRDLTSLDAHVAGQRKGDLAAASAVTERGSGVANVVGYLGSLGAGALDPTSYIPVGSGATVGLSIGRQILKTGVREAAANVGQTVLTEPLVRQDAATLGIERDLGDLASDTTIAAVLGFGIGAGGKALHVGAMAGAPKVGELVAGSREAGLAKLFPLLPEAIRDRWMARGTIGDRALVDAMRTGLGDRATPDERAAMHVLDRDADVRESSPFTPGHDGDVVHGQRLSATIEAMLAGEPVPRWSAAADGAGTRSALLTGGSAFSGVDGVTERIIGHESRGLASARNPNSSASGLGQFTDDTWVATYKQHFGAIGMSRATILGLKTDPALGRQMTRLHVQDNVRALQRADLPVTDGNVYLLHFLGQKAGVTVLRADAAMPVGALVSKRAIAANGSTLRGRSVGEVIAWADRKMGGRGEMPAGVGRVIEEDLPEIETAQLAQAEPEEEFRALDHLEAMRAYVRKTRKSLDPEAVAGELGLDVDQARGVLGLIASTPGSGLIMGKGGTLRRKPVRRGAVDLLTAIADDGGIADTEGHALERSRNLGRFVPGAGPLLRKSGKSIDELGEWMWERGWFPNHPERPDTAEVLELLDRAAAEKIYNLDDPAARPTRDAALTLDEQLYGEIDEQGYRRDLLLERGDIEEVQALVREGWSIDDAIDELIGRRFDEINLAGEVETDGERRAMEAYVDALSSDPDAGRPGGDDRSYGEAGRSPGDIGGEQSRGGEGRDAAQGAARDPGAAGDGEGGDAGLDPFDDPGGPGQQQQLESLEHDLRAELDRGAEIDPADQDRQRQRGQLGAAAPLRAAAEQDGTIGLGLFDAADQPGFQLEEGGKARSIEQVLGDADADVEAWNALGACLPLKGDDA